ncbi:hypothetical protein ACP70R_011729 [Stipagrostis hirtigluma subsp. patula]
MSAVVSKSSPVAVRPSAAPAMATGSFINLSPFDKGLDATHATIFLVFDHPIHEPAETIKRALSQRTGPLLPHRRSPCSTTRRRRRRRALHPVHRRGRRVRRCVRQLHPRGSQILRPFAWRGAVDAAGRARRRRLPLHRRGGPRPL